MLIIDAHLDLSWNALCWNRNLDLTVPEIRRIEAGMKEKGRGTNTVSYPEMRRGQIGICLATLLARFNPKGNFPNLDFRTRELASAMAQGQLAYYRLLEQRNGCRMIRDWPALEASYSNWAGDSNSKDAADGQPLGFILSMEGADPILAPEDFPQWFEAGLRVVGPAHYGPSHYAHGTGCSGGLTEAGRELLRVMEQAGGVLDLTHLCDVSFWEAAKLFQGTVLASHNNCRALTPGDRQFDDDQIRLIVERDGVIGMALDSWMLVPGWNQDPNPARVSLQHVADNIDHISRLAGGTRNIAIGSDLDGGYGTEQSPHDLDTIADMRKLGPILRGRGYSAADVEGIFHGNWMRLFKTAWNKAN